MQETAKQVESKLPECPHCNHADQFGVSPSYRVENIRLSIDETGFEIEPTFAPISEEIYCNFCGEWIADEELAEEIEMWIW